jgi:plastocyanin
VRRSTRDRLVLPILLPVGLLAAMVLVMVLFSRILLNTTADAATVVAITVAVTILVVAAIVASRRGRGAAGLGSLLGVVAGVAMLAGGVALAVAKPGGEEGGGVKAFAAQIAAPTGAATKGFSTTKLSFPAGSPIALTFDNQDSGVPHNVVITKDDIKKDPQTPVLFQPPGTLTGPAKTVYDIKPLPAGSYFFHCEVHPTTMFGTVQVSPSAAGGQGGGGPVVAIAAHDIQFDEKELDFPADAPSTLQFNNEDPGTPHNVAIYTDDSLSKKLFSFDPFTGPAEKSFPVPPLPAGEYFFHCDVHPNMQGTVVVSGGGGGGGPAPGGGSAGGGGGSPPSGGGSSASGPPVTSLPPSGGGAPSASVSVVAQNLQFDTTQLSLTANAPTKLSFDNKDAGTPHNLSIYSADPASDSSAKQLFTFDPVAGPATKDATIPGLPAGTYYFQCDVHPTMHGQVKVT